MNVVMPQVGRPGRPIGIPRRLTSTLAGRETLLSEIQERLLGDEDRQWPRTVALHGVAGAGKTAVAIEYAHRHLAEVGAAWLLPAGNPTSLDEEFRRLAAQLGAATTLFDPRDPVVSVHGVLADYQLPWLLIFDSAGDANAVRSYLPPAGLGLILITSLDGTWPDDEGLLVPPLDLDVAAGFLTNSTGDADGAAARMIAGNLGGLPLALAQAAAYVSTRQLSLADYRDLFLRQRNDLLKQGGAPGHPASVATTLGLALSQLEKASPEARALLRVLAFVAPEPVPVGLLLGLPGRENQDLAAGLEPAIADVLRPLFGSQLAIVEAVFALRRYSLLTATDNDMGMVHRLIQMIIRSQMGEEEAASWRQATATLVGSALPADPELPVNWPVFAVLLPHALAALDDQSDGMARIAEYLGRSGSYLAARDLCEQVYLAREETFGSDDPRTLRARAALAVWIGEAGDPGGARERLKGLLAERAELSDRVDEDTLSDRYQLASFTGRAGDNALAREMLAELLPVQVSVLGEQHRFVLATRHQLAACTGRAGQAAEARDQFAFLLPIRAQVLGPDHPHTLSTRHQLASFTGEVGDYVSARNQFVSLLPIREDVLGPEHPDTLATRSSLMAYAAYAGLPGDISRAREFFGNLPEIRGRILGPDHPDTLGARHQFATFTGRAGEPARARDLFAELVLSRERVSGPEHPDTLAARHQLAAFTGRAGDPVRARELLADLLPVRERVLGLDHPETRLTRENLRIWTRNAAAYEAASDEEAEGGE